MKKSVIIVLGLVGFFLFMKITNADSVYFQNSNGVILNEQEYNFFTNMYWKGYQNNLTLEEFEKIKELNVFNKPIVKKTYEESISTRNSTLTSHLRTLRINRVCSNNCMISLTTEWNGTPVTKSYDLIGMRFENTSLNNVLSTTVTADSYVKLYSNPKIFSNGLGQSILVPNAGNLKIAMSINVKLGGRVYGSYQHAMNNISEYNSNQFTIGANGFGNVFIFNNTSRNIYDGANGVYI